MIVVLAVLVALGCAAASVRRLWIVEHVTALDPDGLVALLKHRGVRAVREAIAEAPEGAWERDLLAAFDAPTEDARAALVNEQLAELDRSVNLWVRVPRVCASISWSASFLLATLVFRNGFAAASGDDFEPGQTSILIHRLAMQAVLVAACGLSGTFVCIWALRRARLRTRVKLAAADRLVEALENADFSPAQPFR